MIGRNIVLAPFDGGGGGLFPKVVTRILNACIAACVVVVVVMVVVVVVIVVIGRNIVTCTVCDVVVGDHFLKQWCIY